MKLVWFATLFLIGCPYPAPDCASGYSRNEAGQCRSTPDSGDLDTDTGSQTDPTALSGPIDIAVLAETSGLTIEDTCDGSVSISIDGETLEGTATCAFVGTVADLIGTDPFSGTISGQSDAGGSAAGTLHMDLGAFGVLDAEWSGSADDSRVTGTFGADTIFVIGGTLEVPVTYTGEFDAIAVQ